MECVHNFVYKTLVSFHTYKVIQQNNEKKQNLISFKMFNRIKHMYPISGIHPNPKKLIWARRQT